MMIYILHILFNFHFRRFTVHIGKDPWRQYIPHHCIIQWILRQQVSISWTIYDWDAYFSCSLDFLINYQLWFGSPPFTLYFCIYESKYYILGQWKKRSQQVYHFIIVTPSLIFYLGLLSRNLIPTPWVNQAGHRP